MQHRQFKLTFGEPVTPLVPDTTTSQNRLFAYHAVIGNIAKDSPYHNAATLHGEEELSIDQYKTSHMPATSTHTTYVSKRDFAAFKRQAWILAIAVVSAVLLLAALVVFVCVYVMVLATRGIA